MPKKHCEVIVHTFVVASGVEVKLEKHGPDQQPPKSLVKISPTVIRFE